MRFSLRDAGKKYEREFQLKESLKAAPDGKGELIFAIQSDEEVAVEWEADEK